MKLLIIGGTGFFGKSIMHSFISKKLDKFNINQLYVLSRSSIDFIKAYPEFINPRIEYINGDIANMNFLPHADIIIHAASSTNQMDYQEDSNREKENTEKGVSNYIKLAKKFHKNSKIIYCSSGAVYGNQPSNVSNIAENFPFQDLGNMTPLKRDYALSKKKCRKTNFKSWQRWTKCFYSQMFCFLR